MKIINYKFCIMYESLILELKFYRINKIKLLVLIILLQCICKIVIIDFYRKNIIF